MAHNPAFKHRHRAQARRQSRQSLWDRGLSTRVGGGRLWHVGPITITPAAYGIQVLWTRPLLSDAERKRVSARLSPGTDPAAGTTLAQQWGAWLDAAVERRVTSWRTQEQPVRTRPRPWRASSTGPQ